MTMTVGFLLGLSMWGAVFSMHYSLKTLRRLRQLEEEIRRLR